MEEKKQDPIFFDPKQRRWARFKRVALALSLVALVAFGTLALGLMVNPQLPALQLQANHPALRSYGMKEPLEMTVHHWESDFGGGMVNARRQQRLARLYPPTLPKTPYPARVAFFVNWDDTSLTSLKANAGNIDILVPEWLHLADGSGRIVEDEPNRTQLALSVLKSLHRRISVLALINNYDGTAQHWDTKALSEAISHPLSRERLIDGMLAFVQKNHLQGINLDLEGIPPSKAAEFRLFVGRVYNRFHASGLIVSLSAPLDDPSYDYRGLGHVCDLMVLMAYDEHFTGGDPGPVASKQWVNAALARRFSELPSYKLIVALGNYGYDWDLSQKNAQELSFQDAVRVARESGAKIALDPVSLNPGYSYEDESNHLHRVWFLDAVTLYNQVTSAKPFRPFGFALWRLGSEDPSSWSVLNPNEKEGLSTAKALEKVRYGYDLDYEGTGEILKVTNTPTEGERTLSFDPASGLIRVERFTVYPSPFEITRWGGTHGKEVAITFDDGPDPHYTPKILDILKRYHAHATFFVIGENANAHPELLKRLFSEGHEIGNHTYTHPNFALVGPWMRRFELSATERLFECRLGHRSLLFRPPYGEDIEPVTPDEMFPLVEAGKMGYYTVGMRVDPGDWMHPGVEKIVRAVVDGVREGKGRVVLLHDGGGNRDQTLQALPQILATLEAEGYRFVPVSELIGLPRDAVMPPVTGRDKQESLFIETAFMTVEWAGRALSAFFLIGILLGIGRMATVGGLAIIHFRREKDRVRVPYRPSVTVLVPAYNEEAVICRTVGSVLDSNYPDLSVIVVDDGSTDATLQRLNEAFRDHPQVRIFAKANGGKASALNFGLARARSEIVVTVDADTILAPDAIARMVERFADPRVGAVAGNAKVGNRVNLLTRWQALEYITSQNLDRRAFDLLNCISVVPGAIGAWRRDLLESFGGFSNSTLAEDADATLEILRSQHRVVYEESAVAFTEAPQTIKGFLKQRTRWTFGTLQVLFKHRDILFRRRYGASGFILIPNVLIFQVLFPFFSPLVDLIPIWALLGVLWDRFWHPLSDSFGSLGLIATYALLFLAVEMASSIVAFVLEGKEDWSLLLWMALQRFFYRQLMYFVAIRSVFAALKGSLVGWNKVERRATVAVKELHEGVD